MITIQKSICQVLLQMSILLTISCVDSKPKYNLDFEQLIDNMPAGWEMLGDADGILKIDSVQTHHGRYSVMIDNDEKQFQMLRYSFDDVYDGKQMILSGYIKTQNLSDGYAGLILWTVPDGDGGRMDNGGVKGTTDWTKYEVKIDIQQSKVLHTMVSCVMHGKGKVWFDNLTLTVDGKNITRLTPVKLTTVSDSIVIEDEAKFRDSSGVQFPTLNKPIIENLDLLGRVWGFLKYHHPAIARGDYNWDLELLRFLPNYLTAQNSEQRDRLILQWIKRLGEIPRYKIDWPTADDAVLRPDHKWIENSDMQVELKQQLSEIYQNRNRGEQYYVKRTLLGVPDFSNEKSYSVMNYPDAGYRLLGLFRYWSVINYFFPYKNLTDRNWDKVLGDFIRPFILADSELKYEHLVAQLIACIDDSHGFLLTGFDKLEEAKGMLWAPIRTCFLGNTLVVDYISPSKTNKDGVKVGDIITHIEGRHIDAIVDSLKPYYAASCHAALLRDISKDLLRSDRNTLVIRYISNGKAGQEQIDLLPIGRIDGNDELLSMYRMKNRYPSHKLLNGNIGYIALGTIQEEEIPSVLEAYKNTKGIVLDQRTPNPNARVHAILADCLSALPDQTFLLSYGNRNNPGEFNLNHTVEIKDLPYYDKRRNEKKLIVLIDEYSQSIMEGNLMILKCIENTILLGNQTAGANGNVAKINFPGGLETYFSSIGVYHLNGEQTQRIGIIPDVVVIPTAEGIKQGRDELLEKAIELINRDETIKKQNNGW